MHDTAIRAAKVAEVGQRIAKLLTADIRVYATGEVRRRFVETPAVADALDDAEVAALKAATAAFAAAAAEALAERLADDALWLGAESPEADDAPVTHIPAVEQALQAVADDLTRFLDRHGLTAGAPLSYRLPARFIDGENLPSLSRALWKAIARYREARAAEAAAREATSAESRAKRWDDA